MGGLWTAGADLFLGADCPGCGHPALHWCRQCALQLRPAPWLVETSLRLPVAAAGRNAGALRAMILAWKEGGRSRLTEPLAVLLASAICLVEPASPIDLVPVPGSAANRRRRGADVLVELADCAASILRETGQDARVSRRLGRARQTRDQAGLGAAARRANLAGALAARSSAERPAVVVDDILTSAATASEAVRALIVARQRVLGVAVAAWTPPPK
jgi:predicted amidophosphoribosyltransferase